MRCSYEKGLQCSCNFVHVSRKQNERLINNDASQKKNLHENVQQNLSQILNHLVYFITAEEVNRLCKKKERQ